MAEQTFQATTILAVDFGTATTRASLFDVVEEGHRFVAAAEAPSTFEPPYADVSEGMRHALIDLQTITGRALLDESAHLIIPASPEGAGADIFVITGSAGRAGRAVLVGLLPEVSVEDARLIAAASYYTVAETISLTDRRRDEQRIDAVIKAQPDLIVLAGGTDGGAREAIVRLADTVNVACHLLPASIKPTLLYLGNPALKDKVTQMFDKAAVVHSAPNIQPELGEAARVFAPARVELAHVFSEQRQAQVGGLAGLAASAGGVIFPTAQAEAQFLLYLSRALELRNVLSLNVGSAATSVATAWGNTIQLTVRPELGIGLHATAILAETPLDKLARWLPFEAPDKEATLLSFIHNKSIYPHTLPADLNDLYLELALAREVMRAGLKRARDGWPAPTRYVDYLRLDLLVGGGAVLAAHPGLAALLLLDAVEPVGFIKNLVLDPYHLMAALGMVAQLNPVAVAQIIEQDPFLRLGAAVCATGSARLGEIICRARVVSEAGTETTADLRAGQIDVLPLPLGQRGKLTLKPRLGIDVGFGPGRGPLLPLEVSGGVVGIVLDGRGRPITFAGQAAKRREQVQQWHWKVGVGGT